MFSVFFFFFIRRDSSAKIEIASIRISVLRYDSRPGSIQRVSSSNVLPLFRPNRFVILRFAPTKYAGHSLRNRKQNDNNVFPPSWPHTTYDCSEKRWNSKLVRGVNVKLCRREGPRRRYNNDLREEYHSDRRYSRFFSTVDDYRAFCVLRPFSVSYYLFIFWLAVFWKTLNYIYKAMFRFCPAREKFPAGKFDISARNYFTAHYTYIWLESDSYIDVPSDDKRPKKSLK